MPVSHSAPPNRHGGWSSAGLEISPCGRSASVSAFPGLDCTGETGSKTIKGAAASTQTRAFFTRHARSISNSLPIFSPNQQHYGDKDEDKHGRAPARWSGRPVASILPARVRAAWAGVGARARTRLWQLLVLLGLLAAFLLCASRDSPLHYYRQRASWMGGGEKFLIILAANAGGGVMEWKGAREWAIERDSIRNKRKYARRWGYELEIADMSTKKRYAHEWRESWEKTDFIRESLRKYPKAEWIWWLDLNTFIMEPSYSLQDHIFADLGRHVYRDINEYNPLNISHPFEGPHLDPESLSPAGDGRVESINLILSQDCAGFNLGSFFVRRGAWTDRLLDLWWDPVAYEQKHMEWEHKEQDALEQLYVAQPWVRKHTAFLPQRMINSFPLGACSSSSPGSAGSAATAAAVTDSRIHYDQRNRDFVVNMAGCEWGRDCWGEMYKFRELSYYLNRNGWERLKEDLLAPVWFWLTGRQIRISGISHL